MVHKGHNRKVCTVKFVRNLNFAEVCSVQQVELIGRTNTSGAQYVQLNFILEVNSLLFLKSKFFFFFFSLTKNWRCSI